MRAMKDETKTHRRASNRQDFDGLVIDSLDEAFSEALGVEGSAMLWQHYQTSLGVTQKEIPYHLPKLFESLEKIFGTGYETIGERVIKKLYAKTNIPLKLSENRPLLEYAKELKQILAKSQP